MSPTSQGERLPYQDRSLPVDQRVQDLLARMTVEEKAGQLGSQMPFSWEFWSQHPSAQRAEKLLGTPASELVDPGMGQQTHMLSEVAPREAAQKANDVLRYALEQTRLGIPPIIHDEGLHGLLANGATSFPQSIGMASSWDPDLLREVATAIGRETRTRGIRQLLSPTINIARDPRCGRTQETYGEDPYLTSRMAVAFIQGVQSQGVVTTPKHFAANFVGDGGRDSNAAHISERLLREVYLPAFQAAIQEGGALSLMAAYNSLDGLPCSCNPWLLTDLLRGEWGFQGFVVSDYDSVIHILTKHAVAKDKTEVAQRALEAGMDVELPYTQCYGQPLVDGVKSGQIRMEALDEAVRRVLKVKFDLGLFDEPYVDPAQAVQVSHSEQHQALALEMARKALVLLKNEGNTLPLAGDARSIAVLGPLANVPNLGDYTWDAYPAGWFVTPLQGIQAQAGSAEVRFAAGCGVRDSVGDTSPEDLAQAVELARGSQVAVVFVGNTTATEGEGRDRADLSLPGRQAELIKAVAATGTPTVVVLINGSAVILTDWIDDVSAVLEAWYPGEKGGTAIAEALFGDINPGGKLPITFPRAVGQLPLYYNAKPSGRDYGYVDLTGAPLFPFGYGLSYTTFEYRNLGISPETTGINGTVTVTVEVQNTGGRAGDEVVQLYVRDLLSTYARPIKELKAFRRIHLEPGQTQTVTFQLEAQSLGYYGADMRYTVEPGDFEIQVGSSSADIRQTGTLHAA